MDTVEEKCAALETEVERLKGLLEAEARKSSEAHNAKVAAEEEVAHLRQQRDEARCRATNAEAVLQ
ncbi:hypothetical protein AAVH_20513, partial [Aphelenchoides avenae]